MSHIADVKLHVLDIAALKAAVEADGGIWHEGQTTHRWYGRVVGGATSSRDPRTFGKCLHAIEYPGINYQIGVVAHESGKGYDLAYDNWGSGGQHDGQLLERRLGGPGLPKLRQGYAVSLTKRQLSRQGYRVTTTTLPNGEVRVTAKAR